MWCDYMMWKNTGHVGRSMDLECSACLGGSQRIKERAQHTQSVEMFETDSDLRSSVDITRTCLPRPGRFQALLRASVQGQGGRVIGVMIKARPGKKSSESPVSPRRPSVVT